MFLGTAMRKGIIIAEGYLSLGVLFTCSLGYVYKILEHV
jgi:hypothetical protein